MSFEKSLKFILCVPQTDCKINCSFNYFKIYFLKMKNIKKENLPIKTCITCNRPFTWRKKWEKVWDEVKYCSDKCRMTKK